MIFCWVVWVFMRKISHPEGSRCDQESRVSREAKLQKGWEIRFFNSMGTPCGASTLAVGIPSATRSTRRSGGRRLNCRNGDRRFYRRTLARPTDGQGAEEDLVGALEVLKEVAGARAE